MAEEQTLSIRINADGKALLSTDRTGEFWTAIHRSIEERAKDALNLSPTSIILPWWQFIRCRNSILYLCEKWGPVNVSVDEPARRLLEKAIRSEDQYQLAQQSKKADTQEIEIALRKSGFRRTLKSAQLRNVAALLNLPAGATFSVPGAGKTTEALALFQLKRGKGSKLMIICPKNAFVAWEEQTAACFDSPPAITRLEGKNNIPQMLENEPAIALITYQQLITVEKHVAEFLAKHKRSVGPPHAEKLIFRKSPPCEA